MRAIERWFQKNCRNNYNWTASDLVYEDVIFEEMSDETERRRESHVETHNTSCENDCGTTRDGVREQLRSLSGDLKCAKCIPAEDRRLPNKDNCLACVSGRIYIASGVGLGRPFRFRQKLYSLPILPLVDSIKPTLTAPIPLPRELFGRPNTVVAHPPRVSPAPLV